MAYVRLSRSEVRKDLMPPVCVVCGAPSVVRRDRSFTWFPVWIWLIFLVSWVVGLILFAVLTKSMRVRLPACAEHEGIWRRRRARVTVGWFVVLALCGVLFVSLGVQPEGRQKELTVPVCGTSAGVFAVWVVALLIVYGRGVRATQITDRSISLAGVHDEFVEALEDDRERDRAEDEAEQRELRALLRERRERRRAARLSGGPAPAPPLAEPVYGDLEYRAGELIDRDDPSRDRPAS